MARVGNQPAPLDRNDACTCALDSRPGARHPPPFLRDPLQWGGPRPRPAGGGGAATARRANKPGLNGTQAIFLNKAGPQAYPLFFVVLALAVWPMVALQGALTRRLGVGRTLRLTLVLNAVIAPILYIVYFISEAPTVAFTVYVIYS